MPLIIRPSVSQGTNTLFLKKSGYAAPAAAFPSPFPVLLAFFLIYHSSKVFCEQRTHGAVEDEFPEKKYLQQEEENKGRSEFRRT